MLRHISMNQKICKYVQMCSITHIHVSHCTHVNIIYKYASKLVRTLINNIVYLLPGTGHRGTGHADTHGQTAGRGRSDGPNAGHERQNHSEGIHQQPQREAGCRDNRG